jgi:predicted NUDIX family NTP pyrophosphohydrolase
MKQSSGVLVYRRKGGKIEVLLGHPGGPYWAGKDKHSWSIPKGEFVEDEAPLDAAKREFKEETGHDAPVGEYIELGFIKIPSKHIYCWAVEGDLDVGQIKSNKFKMEWPPKSGKQQEFPELDKAAWVEISHASAKMHKGQAEFIDRLAEHLGLQLEKPEQPSLF